MNERIRELAEQAFFDEATSRPSGKMYTFSDHKMAKFAELIVRECAQFVEDEFDFIGDEIIVKEKMLEYFGVKE